MTLSACGGLDGESVDHARSATVGFECAPDGRIANACDIFRRAPSLLNPYSIPDAYFSSSNRRSGWDATNLNGLSSFPIGVCVDKKGVVVVGAMIGSELGNIADMRRFEPDHRVRISDRLRLAMTVYASPFVVNLGHSAHVNASTPSAGILSAKVRGGFLRDMSADFLVPGSVPTRREHSPVGMFVMTGNAFVDGWLEGDEDETFRPSIVVTPATPVYIEFSTSKNGQPVDSSLGLNEDERFRSRIIVGDR